MASTELEPKSYQKTWLIVGVVVGVILVLSVSFCCCWTCCIKPRRNKLAGDENGMLPSSVHDRWIGSRSATGGGARDYELATMANSRGGDELPRYEQTRGAAPPPAYRYQ